MARANGMAPSPPYLLVEQAYLVPPGSPITASADVDRPGVRIAVGAEGPPNAFLRTSLQQAELVAVPGASIAAFDLVVSGGADVAASGRQVLLGFADRLPGSRILEESFAVVEHVGAVPPTRIGLLPSLSEIGLGPGRGRPLGPAGDPGGAGLPSVTVRDSDYHHTWS